MRKAKPKTWRLWRHAALVDNMTAQILQEEIVTHIKVELPKPVARIVNTWKSALLEVVGPQRIAHALYEKDQWRHSQYVFGDRRYVATLPVWCMIPAHARHTESLEPPYARFRVCRALEPILDRNLPRMEREVQEAMHEHHSVGDRPI